MVRLLVERYDTNMKWAGFDPSFKQPMCLATLKSCDTTKQSVCGWQYIRSPTGVVHSGEGNYGCHSHNAKLFERIEHSGIQSGKNVNKRRLLHNAL